MPTSSAHDLARHRPDPVPRDFPGPLGLSLAGRAFDADLWSLDAVNIRDFATDRHRTVDDTPFGGGAGMVMRPDVVDAAARLGRRRPARDSLLCLTPRGAPLHPGRPARLAAGPGVDPAVRPLRGHRPARHRGARHARRSRSATTCCPAANCRRWCCWTPASACCPASWAPPTAPTRKVSPTGLLEYPHYTRPAEWQGRRVPEVLLSGHHAAVAAWRRAEAERHHPRAPPRPVGALRLAHATGAGCQPRAAP